MRLKAIRLHGFKSFVDPTYIPFASNLTAVVGPNGCGKSNIIDAVRWVMGESSVKALRGENMADVIFNGSSLRKPLSYCSVELIFDNGDFSLAGPFAAYAQISLKRKVTRDGQSQYYLNASKCRRKDVLDLFMGTGLGPRSYAIIEQGMINRLIEAKPDELRLFVEEAAGISRYKERRKETSQKMARTLDNLARLQDVEHELQRQCRALHVQAEQAERWQALKGRERQLQQWLYAQQWQQLSAQQAEAQQALDQGQGELLQLSNQEWLLQQQLTQSEERWQQGQQQWQRAQQRFFQQQTQVAKLEQRLQHSQQQQLLLDSDQQQLEQQQQQLRDREQQEQTQLDTATQALLALNADGQSVELHFRQQQQQAQQLRQDWQQQQQALLQHQQSLGHAQAKEAALRARLQALQSQRMQAQSRLAQQAEPIGQVDGGDLSALEQHWQQHQQRYQQAFADWQAFEVRLTRAQNEREQVQQGLKQGQQQWQHWQQRLAQCQAKVDALGSEDASWLARQSLAQTHQVISQLHLQRPEWQQALDSWLQTWSQARLASPAIAARPWADNRKSSRWLFASTNPAEPRGVTLADVVTAPDALVAHLRQVHLCLDLADAERTLASLSAGQYVIVANGLQLGPDWLYWPGELIDWSQLEQALREAIDHVARLDDQVFEGEAQDEHLALQLQQLNTQKPSLQASWQEAQQAAAQAELQYRQQQTQWQSEQQSRSLHHEQRQQQLDHLHELAEQIFDLEEALHDLHDDDSETDDEPLTLDQRLQWQLAEAETEVEEAREQWQQWQLQRQQLTQQQQQYQQLHQRTQDQLAQLAQRQQQLAARLLVPDQDWQQLAQELHLEQQLLADHEASVAKALLDSEQWQRQRAQQQQALDALVRALSDKRHALSQAELQLALVQEKQHELQQKVDEQQWALSHLLAHCPVEANVAQWRQQLQEVKQSLASLGTVNLMAIDGYRQAMTRQQYLHEQHQQLDQALAILDQAIARIDQETRSRFSATFAAINAGFADLFPIVFGGGHASLNLVEQDMLSSGVSIMAQPPGKKNSTIHLLSGGEKALTAIALVFAIFRLNPAPFCLLDEVDAPLDEANVVRYADLVAKMSTHLQFIYISHNKAAMARASELMGVTMSEPGVSRLVSVNLEQATALVAES